MKDQQTELAEIFAGLSDEYLLEQSASGDLTEAAQSAAERELRARGIEPPPPVLRPVQDDGTAEDAPVDFVTVARFLLPTDAHILRGRLEAEGIPAVVTDANLVQANNLISVAVGGVRVQVPVNYVTEAIAVVAAVRRGDYALRDGVEPDAGGRDSSD